MAASSLIDIGGNTNEAGGPRQSDLDKCVHCGLCLNACPTYRELGVEMDSPRGRIYQMNQVANGAPISADYIRHMELCLACRGCETACPSGVPYGHLIEAAREQIEQQRKRSLPVRLFRSFLLRKLIPSRGLLTAAGMGLYLYQASGFQRLLRAGGLLNLFGPLGSIEALSPNAEFPFFFPKIGRTFPADGERKYRVAFLAGCIANIAFARLNEATVRVLQKNGCEVVVPADQSCCGALAVHQGMKDEGRRLARINIDAVDLDEFDAVITNAAGCGSTLKEYRHLLEQDAAYRDTAAAFVAKMRDITEFLAAIGLRGGMRPLNVSVTYQDSCHLAHGQKISAAPRKLLRSLPGVTFREMPAADVCCGSAGVYNLVEHEMADQLLRHKMESIATTKAEVIVTANPGCMLQLEAGARLYGEGQRVLHVVQLIDEAYRPIV